MNGDASIAKALDVLQRLRLGDHHDGNPAADASAYGLDIRQIEIRGVVGATAHFADNGAAGHDHGDHAPCGIRLALHGVQNFDNFVQILNRVGSDVVARQRTKFAQVVIDVAEFALFFVAPIMAGAESGDEGVGIVQKRNHLLVMHAVSERSAVVMRLAWKANLSKGNAMLADRGLAIHHVNGIGRGPIEHHADVGPLELVWAAIKNNIFRSGRAYALLQIVMAGDVVGKQIIGLGAASAGGFERGIG